MIVLAFDYGLSHIGVGVGDTVTKLSRPLAAISNSPLTLSEISLLTAEFKPKKIVVGVSEKKSALDSREFGARLQARLGLPVIFVDETLSSFEAGQKIRHKPLIKRRKMRHSAAAAVILERWLEES